MKIIIYPAAIFIIGALLGASFGVVLTGNQIDSLYIENLMLQENLLVADQQIQQLQKTSKTSEKRVINSIGTYVSFVENSGFSEFEKSSIELTLEKNVREWLNILSGQNVDEVNYQLIPGIIDNREIEIEGKKIHLTVNLVVISEKVSIYLEVRPLR